MGRNVLGVDGDHHRSGLHGLPRISARVKVPGRENWGRFVIKDCLPEIWEEFLFVLGEQGEREGVYCQLDGGGGVDKKSPGVFAHRERLVECPGAGVAVGGVGRGGCGLVCDSEGDCPADVHQGRETKREKAVGVAKDMSSDVRECCCNGWGIWVRGWSLAGSEETSLCTWQRRRPLVNRGGCCAGNLLGGPGLG